MFYVKQILIQRVQHRTRQLEIVHLLNVVVKINSSLFNQRSASHSLKNKEDSTDRLILHGTEIFHGSPFVHHSKKCSAFIVEEQQLKVCYRLYLQSIVH